MRLIPFILVLSVLISTSWGINEPAITDTPPISTQEAFCETNHTITLNGQTLSYKATLGSILLKDKNSKPTANIFFTSYCKNTENVPQKRPITFCFNGGPGSSSVWLHIGFAGPQIVSMNAKGINPTLPNQLVDNEFSLLDITDLVFIDPVSTGFSQAIPPDSEENFYSTRADISCIGTFIQSFLTKFNRWDSAKFVMGESYGTLRASGLADYLHNNAFIDLDGIILISSVLDYQLLSTGNSNDLPYLLFLPSYTAAAWYHKKLPLPLQKDLDQALQASKEFVFSEYTPALFKGDLLSKEEKLKIIDKISELTGLSPKYIEKNNLRISPSHFMKELLADTNQLIGRFDSQTTGSDLNMSSSEPSYDPSTDYIVSAFTRCFNSYLSNNLNWKSDTPYTILSNAICYWNFNAENEYLSVSDNLQTAMTKNPHLQVFVASGYFDLAIPFFSTEYTFNHMQLDPSIKSHITLKNYQGGHMMYFNRDTLKQLKVDLSAFYQQATPTPPANEL